MKTASYNPKENNKVNYVLCLLYHLQSPLLGSTKTSASFIFFINEVQLYVFQFYVTKLR